MGSSAIYIELIFFFKKNFKTSLLVSLSLVICKKQAPDDHKSREKEKIIQKLYQALKLTSIVVMNRRHFSKNLVVREIVSKSSGF